MTKMLVLNHKTLGECARQVITKKNPRYEIEHLWKKRYGKQMEHCQIILEEGISSVALEQVDDIEKEHPIRNVITGEIYKTKLEAHRDTGLSLTIVWRHLYKKNKPGFKYLLKWA